VSLSRSNLKDDPFSKMSWQRKGLVLIILLVLMRALHKLRGKIEKPKKKAYFPNIQMQNKNEHLKRLPSCVIPSRKPQVKGRHGYYAPFPTHHCVTVPETSPPSDPGAPLRGALDDN
jgi:hypothetical protein